MSDSNLPTLISPEDLQAYGTLLTKAIKNPLGRFLLGYLKKRYNKKAEKQDSHDSMIDASMKVQIDADAQAQASLIHFESELKKGQLLKEYIDKQGGPHFIHEQIRKDYNVDTTIKMTFEEIANSGDSEQETAEHDISDDWFTRWRDIVGGISEESTQRIWARILSGETRKPGTFSYRTLEVLKNLSKDEAELFLKIAPYILWSVDMKLIFEGFLREQTGFHHIDLVKLTEAGLIADHSLTTLSLFKGDLRLHLAYHDRVILLSLNEEDIKSTKVIVLTESAYQISKIMGLEFSVDYLRGLKEYLNRLYPGINMSHHQILSYREDGFPLRYNSEGITI